MTDTEELQAQVDALRLLVLSLVARTPAEEISKDVRIRFEAWQDVHIHTTVSEDYLSLMQEEMRSTLGMLNSLREQQISNTEPVLVLPLPLRKRTKPRSM